MSKKGTQRIEINRWEEVKGKLFTAIAGSGLSVWMFAQAAREHTIYTDYVRSGHQAQAIALGDTAPTIPPGAISAALGLLCVGIVAAESILITKALEPYRPVDISHSEQSGNTLKK